MQVTKVSDALGKIFSEPILSLLEQNLSDCDVILYQPVGKIIASVNGVRRFAQDSAYAESRALLSEIVRRSPHLFVAPEYSIPWTALKDAITSGDRPQFGHLWALGCESITRNELETFIAAIHDSATVICEPLDGITDSRTGFLDPLVYVFRATDAQGLENLILLIQFKTHPSVDNERIECGGLRLGNCVYKFGDKVKSNQLVSFICSDSMALPPEQILLDLCEKTLLLHIQLNPDPRHNAYRAYRDWLFQHAERTTQLICLNWARGVTAQGDDNNKVDNLTDNAASAWYLRPERFNYHDDAIDNNHREGLYYTWLEPLKVNVLCFNYTPSLFVLKSTKVWQGLVPQAQKTVQGPRLLSTLQFNENAISWENRAIPLCDGFKPLIKKYKTCAKQLKSIYDRSPVAVERLLALTAGDVKSDNPWYSVTHVDAFTTDSSEIVRRITFAQDSSPSADQFRKRRIGYFVELHAELGAGAELPPAMRRLKGASYKFDWEYNLPTSNVHVKRGPPATIIYVGVGLLEDDFDNIWRRISQHRRNGEDEDQFCIYYRHGIKLEYWVPPRVREFMRQSDGPLTDIANQ